MVLVRLRYSNTDRIGMPVHGGNTETSLWTLSMDATEEAELSSKVTLSFEPPTLVKRKLCFSSAQSVGLQHFLCVILFIVLFVLFSTPIGN